MSVMPIEHKPQRRVHRFSGLARFAAMVAGAIHFFSCPCHAADELKTNMPANAPNATADASDALRSLRREVDNVGAARAAYEAAYKKESGRDEEERLWD